MSNGRTDERIERARVVGVNMEGSGSDQDAADQQNPARKRYHRHTAHQIQELEALFKKHPHPDEKQRLQLSRDLGLEPRQVKFWFQNRRTQMKAQGERADNNTLRAENERIRGENLAIREALKYVLCSNCGGPPAGETSFEEQHRLRLENARLKEELDRLSGIAAKYIGRPIQTPASLHPISMPSLDLGMVGYGAQNVGPSTDIISPSQSLAEFAMPTGFALEKNLMRELAINAMDEVTNLAHTDEPLWIRNLNDNKDVLSLECYTKIFPRAMESKAYNVRKEVSRDSGLVVLSGHSLADIFMDTNKWAEMFPTIVARAKTIEVIIPGTPGNRNGSLQLMYAELHVLAHLVLPREIYFLRYCHQSPDGIWAIVDVSVDNIIQNPQASLSRCRKLPSGLVIQDMTNGYCKVTWVEHVEPEDRAGVHRLYRQLVNSGMAFGAHRWLVTLQRNCERLTNLMAANISTREPGVSSPDERRFLMKLAQRMTSTFCANISASTAHRWSAASGSNDDGVRLTTRKNASSTGTVLSAATSLWLPVSPQRVFEFFRDKRNRPQWDAVSGGNSTEEVVDFPNGSHPGNCITLLRAYTSMQNNLFILQESCTDSSGSLIVYAPVDINAMKAAMNSGADPSIIPVLPSGISILPDGSDNRRLQASSSNSSSIGSPGNTGGGSLLTVVFEINVGNSSSSNMEPHATTVNHIVCNAVQQIKAALHCLDV